MIDKDTIIKLARSADWHVEADGYINSRVEAAMKAAYQQGLERAAEICLNSTKCIEDEFYGRECASLIRAEAHAQNQPKTTHDGSVV